MARAIKVSFHKLQSLPDLCDALVAILIITTIHLLLLENIVSWMDILKELVAERQAFCLVVGDAPTARRLAAVAAVTVLTLGGVIILSFTGTHPGSSDTNLMAIFLVVGGGVNLVVAVAIVGVVTVTLIIVDTHSAIGVLLLLSFVVEVNVGLTVVSWVLLRLFNLQPSGIIRNRVVAPFEFVPMALILCAVGPRSTRSAAPGVWESHMVVFILHQTSIECTINIREGIFPVGDSTENFRE